ncbi:hypothetical protein ABKN59_006838 [Abortiporus biennis]
MSSSSHHHSSLSNHLTVVRTSGILFLRPEKSWRPIVSIIVGDADLPHEFVLGCDGQNPNTKQSIPLHNIEHKTKLDIRVYHKSHSKNGKKRHLVGSAYVSVGEILQRQSKPGVDIDLSLSCPPPQKRSSTIGGRKSNCASLTIRIHCPALLTAPATTPLTSTSSVTAIGSASGADYIFSDGTVFSDGALSDAPLISPQRVEHDPPKLLMPVPFPDKSSRPPSTLRRRRKKPKTRGYSIYTEDEQEPISESSYSFTSCSSDNESSTPFPPSPKEEFFTSTRPLVFKPATHNETITIATYDSEENHWIAPSMLPRYTAQQASRGAGETDIYQRESLSTLESFVDTIGPYKELMDATTDSDFEKVLGRLLTEWYVVGASLLAVAGLNAAVFGFSSDSLFAVDGLAKRSIAIGSIAAGIGLVVDAWFIVRYSGANVEKFKAIALDVYSSYIFFSLACRLPSLLMFISSLSLTTFLLTVAWEAWPTAVIVMSFLAGILVGLQYLVYGVHRGVNFIIWVVRCTFRGIWRIFGRKDGNGGQHGHAQNDTGGGNGFVVENGVVVGRPSRPSSPLPKVKITMPEPSLG